MYGYMGVYMELELHSGVSCVYCQRKYILNNLNTPFTNPHNRVQKHSLPSLASLLIKPVQRICKYPLLFQKLLKQMEKLEAVYPDRQKGNIHRFTLEVEKVSFLYLYSCIYYFIRIVE